RKEGDRQMPEGFYHVAVFNPESNFYLSLGLDYPNQSDEILSNAADKGGDIYIHGDCVTIGCFPLTDDKIKEVYCCAVDARDSGQAQIPVEIYPMKLTQKNMDLLKSKYGESSDLYKFWLTMRPAYDYFEKNHRLTEVAIANDGKYV